MTYNADTTTNDIIQGFDCSDKTVLITGASGGLGLETARALGSIGAKLILLARNQDKLKLAKEQLEQQNITHIETVVCDLSDLQSIQTASKDILDRFSRIDVLINNAGVMACPLSRTAQGFESQFGTNHIGHFYLTLQIIDLLKQAKSARIVNLSSAGHKLAPVNFDDPNYQTRDYEKWQAYGEAKTANALFSIGLEQRYAAFGIHSFAVHPGMIATDLGRHLTEDDFASFKGAQFKSVEQGAATSVWAACHPELESKGGLYLEDCHIAAKAEPGVDGGVESYASNIENANTLWDLSESMLSAAGY